MDINVFDNYGVHALTPQNTESGEPVIKYIGDKFQDSNESILHNDIINSKWDQISDMIKKFDPPLQWRVENGNLMNFKYISFLEDNNINLPLQKGDRWYS